MSKDYGSEELRYAEPFADALVQDGAFRSWVLRQTKFADFAHGARLLHREMKAQRSGTAKNWWRSHFTESCRCPGCKGQETDLLAIFETTPATRFALHFEVKHPRDTFKVDGTQAASYPIRAACWTAEGKTPGSVLPHTAAATVLLCSHGKLAKYAAHVGFFDTVITFEEIEKHFPHASAKRIPII